MKVRKIAETYGLDENTVNAVIKELGIFTSGLFSPEVDDRDVPQIVDVYHKKYSTEHNQWQALEKAKKEMLLSTCPTVEGYRVTKQLGLVFGECAYKTGFFKTLSASLDDTFDRLALSEDKELSGTARLLEAARDYAIRKMTAAAAARGANAVIGIDSETSIGGEIMHITIYGTAVVLEPLSAPVSGEAQ